MGPLSKKGDSAYLSVAGPRPSVFVATRSKMFINSVSMKRNNGVGRKPRESGKVAELGWVSGCP